MADTIIKNNTENINKHGNNEFKDICPGTTKSIDCNTVEGVLQVNDAFYGVSNAIPTVCAYELVFRQIIHNEYF